MFDLSAGTLDRPFRDKHAAATAFSALIHAVVLGSVAWLVLSAVNEKLPEVPSMMAFLAAPPAPALPPPPPAPAARPAAANKPARPADASAPVFTAPAEIPVGIQPETLVDSGEEGGVVGGVVGGIPGGVLGGLPGGIVTDVAPPPPPPPPPVTPKRVGGDIRAPALRHRVEPVYPALAVANRVTGVVILEATVDETGKVIDVKVLRGLLFLDDAAVHAVKQWRYEPLVLNGQAFPFTLTVTLTFSLT
jgi:protein TonB